MTWYVVDHAGVFDTEGQALAAAWEVTPPGGRRPEVTRREPVAKVTVDGENRTYESQMLFATYNLGYDRYRSEDQVKGDLVAALRVQADKLGLIYDAERIVVGVVEDPTRLSRTVRATVQAWPKELGFVPIENWGAKLTIPTWFVESTTL
jgi:hypothetical protein